MRIGFLRPQLGLSSVLATVVLLAQWAPAQNIFNSATSTFTANNGTLGTSVTMGTNGHLVLNGIASDSVNTFTGTFGAGGTPNRGSAHILINTHASSQTVLNLSTWGFTPNKTDILLEANNIGGTGPNSAQLKFTTTPPVLYFGGPTVTATNSTILVHDLASDTYNLATYDAATGVRGLKNDPTNNPNDYVVDAFTANTNALITTSIAQNAAVQLSTLTLRSGGSGVDVSGSGSITFPDVPGAASAAGVNGILSDGASANTISVATLRANATDGLTIHTIADLTISSNLIAGWLVKANAGKLTLSGTNNFDNTVPGGSPSININGGTLSVSSNANLGASSNVVTLLGGALEITESITFDHQISTYHGDTNVNVIRVTDGKVVGFTGGLVTRGSGGVSWSGPGTAIVSAASTYTGATRINGGTVVANHNNAVSAATSVAGGARFQVNSGLVLAPSSGSLVVTLSAADSRLVVGSTGDTGTAGVTGGITATSGGTLDVDVNGTTNATDRLNVSGTVNGGTGTLTISFTDLGGSALQIETPYTLLAAGTLSGTPTLVGNVTSMWLQLDTSYHGTGLFWDSTTDTLTVQFVPEPASMTLLALGGAGLLVRRRRRA